MTLIIGLTGNIATGKTTVLQYLAERGAQIIDADKLAHEAMAPGGPAYQAIIDEFGTEILAADGTVDLQALGRVVFSDVMKLGELERIVHPAVFEITAQRVEESQANLVVLEAVKLLEAGTMASLCDEIWVVTADPATQRRRLMEMRGMDEEQARQRMQMQSPQAAKINQADRVIENNGTLEELYAQLDSLWADLKRRYSEQLSSPTV